MKRRPPLTRKILLALGIPSVFFPGLILAAVLGWDWQKDLSRLAKTGGYKQSPQIFPAKVQVVEVLDGDTFQADNGQTIRLVGIDAPNRGQLGWEEAKNYLQNLIDGEEVELEYDYYQDDKFGRILAYVWEKCAKNLGCQNNRRLVNWVLVKQGLAKVVTYEDRRPLKYENLLRSAEPPP